MGLSMYSGWIFFAFFMFGAGAGIIGTFIWALWQVAKAEEERGGKK